MLIGSKTAAVAGVALAAAVGFGGAAQASVRPAASGTDTNCGDGFCVSAWYYNSYRPDVEAMLCNNQSSGTDFTLRLVDTRTQVTFWQVVTPIIPAHACETYWPVYDPYWGDPISVQGNAGSGWVGTDPIYPA